MRKKRGVKKRRRKKEEYPKTVSQLGIVEKYILTIKVMFFLAKVPTTYLINKKLGRTLNVNWH